MNLIIDSLKLKGHGSFYLREGWLRKGILAIKEDATFFSCNDTTDVLGVGSNMVDAIKYYLQATELTEESYASNRKKKYTLTEDFGEIIFKNDEYFEDVFTLWLLHYKLTQNDNLATSWYMFFNGIEREEISKEDVKLTLGNIIEKNFPNDSYSERSLTDDINCIIKSYKSVDYEGKTPEENLICPFAELGLLKEGNNLAGEKVLFKLKPSMEKLNSFVILYVIVDKMYRKGTKNSDINSLLEEPGNVGRVFNIDRTLLNQYLDLLNEQGFIDINRTAGLDQVYVKFDNNPAKFELPSDILKYYYENEGVKNA